MRVATWLGLGFTCSALACGSNNSSSPDAHTGDGGTGDGATPAQILPGGGIANGPIAGLVHVYAIDDATRQPVVGAQVTVGTVTGTTDATGLFTATGVTGKQTILVTASSYRSELWLGANGENCTVDLHPAVAATPQQATISGTIDLSSFTVMAGHQKVAGVTYSQDDTATDGENNLAQNGSQDCLVLAGGASPCTFSVAVRPGDVALGAAVFDRDPNGGGSGSATLTLIGWAQKTGLVVTAGSDQTGVALSPVAAADTTTETVAFGTPPASLPVVAAVVGVELGSDGVLDLPSLVTPGAPSVLVPKLSVFPSATYRLTGIAKASDADTVATSVVLAHAQTGATLTAPSWLTPTTSATVNHTSATWASVPGAAVQSVDIASSTSDILNITSFDGTTTVTFPASAQVPATGALSATLGAIAVSAGFDVNNFAIDTDRDDIIGEASLPTQVAN